MPRDVDETSRREARPSAAEKSSHFTWQDVAAHNTAKSAWVIVDGGVYDVTEWLGKHPGGSEVLLLSAGRDCTDLFASYHCLSLDRARKTLAAYKVGELEGPGEFPSYKPDSSGFYATLSRRVAKYFDEKRLDPKDPRPGLLLLIPMLAAFSLSYCATYGIGIQLPLWGRLASAVAMGWLEAMPLLHTMHDCCHLAMSHNELLQKVVGRFVFDFFAGGSMMSWQHQHVMGHHVYTNVYQADPDLPINSKDMRRLVDRQRAAQLYSWQWLYMPVLYFLLTFKYRYDDIVEMWIARKNGTIRVNMFNDPVWRFLVPKAFWVGWRILVPIFLLNVSVPLVLGTFLIAELTAGAYLAYNFQVSHISDECDWPLGQDEDGQDSHPPSQDTDREWAKAQVETSVNYGGGWLANFLSGHLNFQIEHHLFPGISQYHYPGIAPIVEQTCKEFNVQYKMYPNFLVAFRHHLSHLYEMGKRGIPAHLD